MAVVRVNKTNDYTIMSNEHFKVKEMSLKAKGLLSLMLSLPDNWDYSVAGLVAICVEKETAINATLKELKKFGYLRIDKIMPNKTKTGRIEYVYNIFESAKQGVEKQGVDFLGLEIQGLENQGQLNTNNKKLNNKKLNNNNINQFQIEFEDLWDLYPRKQGKINALKAYIKARQNGVEFDKIKDGVNRYCDYCKKAEIETNYIKYGSSWFSQECWNDEFKISASKSRKKDSKNFGFEREYTKEQLDSLFMSIDEIKI